jgi:uncharacterized protein YutE (UPF0331/DUF86 family)
MRIKDIFIKIKNTKRIKPSIIIILIFTLANLIWVLFGKPLFLLNENQTLYFLSTIPQVIAGIFGLTLAAYIFFLDKFKESAKSDDTYFEAMNSLISQHYTTLKLIAINCGFALILSTFGIILLPPLQNQILYSFLINQISIFFIIAIISILIFGITLLDPEKLNKETSILKRKAEEFYQDKMKIKRDAEGNFNEFLISYNLLENLIISFAERLNKERANVYPYSNYRFKPKIIDSLKILCKNEVVSVGVIEEINELRKYRNGLVHGIDSSISISQSINNRINEIFEKLNNMYELYKPFEERNEQYRDVWNKAYKELNY